MLGVLWRMKMAKNVSSTHRATLLPRRRPRLSPLASRRPSERGMAAPIEKRKKGKTRSTHVMPQTLVSNALSGGGVCA